MSRAFFWVAALLFSAGPVMAFAAEPIETIDALWSGFDPRELPLDVEVVKAWDEGDVHLETVYFNGEEFEGSRVRIFGHFGGPKNVEGKIPAVLHIHGGGQTATLEWPRFWAARGYACLSFDFCGDTNSPELGAGYRREHFTKWGNAPANMMKVSGGLSMSPSPRHNPWYHWMLACRRGLTFLESQPEVDADRLGIFGISVGGTLTWGVASVDSRVKAAAPIYGCGWEFYPYPPDTNAPVEENLRLWRALIAPETHAPRISCPIFLLNATNDFHGRMDLGYRTLALVKSPVRGQVFTPNYDHHVEPDEAKSLPLFMDAHLRGIGGPWPETPRIEIAGGDLPTVRVSPANSDQVSRVDVYYCLNNDWPTTRFWRTVTDMRREGEDFLGSTPFLESSDVLFAFANVSYDGGMRVSTSLIRQPVSALGDVKPTLVRERLIDSMDDDTAWTWVPAYTDPSREDRFFAPWVGEGDERGFTLNPKTFHHAGAMSFYFGTRKIGDPQVRGIGRTVLQLNCLSGHEPTALSVRVRNRNPGEPEREYSATSDRPIGEGRWKTWEWQANQFEDAAGNVLANWDRVEHFIVSGTSPENRPPVFKRLRWKD